MKVYFKHLLKKNAINIRTKQFIFIELYYFKTINFNNTKRDKKSMEIL